MQLYPRTDRGFSPDYYAYRTHRGVSPDLLPQEYTGCNVGDFRLSCLTVADSRGAFGADFTYVSHTVEAGKYQLTGLPCAHAEENDAETLIVRMQDETTGLTLELLYGVFAQQDVITRAARLTNHGDATLRLDKAASACLDLPFGRWDLLHFHGRHAMERQLEREAVGTNIQTISSVRGSSSHHNNPFLDPLPAGCNGDQRCLLRGDDGLFRQLPDGRGALSDRACPGSERHSGGTLCVEPEAGRNL